jgi:hypothetical protein
MTTETVLILVLHSGPGVIDHLSLLPGGAPDLVVEIGSRPSLAHRLKLATPPDFPGLAGLASPHSTLDELISVRTGGVPVLFAPGAACAPEATLEGLARLRARVTAGKRVAVLLAVDETAWETAEVLSWCDQVVVLWNPVRPTPLAMPARIQNLVSERSLTMDTWGGWIFQPSEELSAKDEVALRRTLAAHPGVAAPSSL